MTDFIQLYAPNTTISFTTLTADSVTLSVFSDGGVYYQTAAGWTQVGKIDACLSSPQLTMILQPQPGADVSQYTYVSGAPLTMETIVTAGIAWTVSSGDLDITITTPATSGDAYEWTFTGQVPPVALKVNIRRQ